MKRASKIFTPESSKATMVSTGGLTKSAIEELQYHLPMNQQRVIVSRAPSLAIQNRDSGDRKATSRPTTANSAFSETFRRPWNWRRSHNNKILAPEVKQHTLARTGEVVSKPAPTFWVEEQDMIDSDKQDIEWRPPSDWAVVGPVGLDANIPAVPMPAFLKPSAHVDPRTIDPSSFPIPSGREQSGAFGRWSNPQSSYALGQRPSSVAGDSIFCTCDLEDIEEEGSSLAVQNAGNARGHGKGRVSMSGSSIHTRHGRCKACIRRSTMAATLVAANSQSQPTTPLTPAFGSQCTSSVRKPRRKRRQETAPRTKIAVAGRLYQET